MDRASPPADVWLHESIEVSQSPIAGRGLFATTPLPANTIVMRLGGRVVSTAGLHAMFAAADAQGGYVDTITVDDDMHLVLPEGTAAHFGNHCCDPSMWHVGPFELALRRGVEAGDELTMDYGTNSGDATFTMDCTCGSQLCHGTITGFDWQRPELQRRYRGHWIPALGTRIGHGS